MTIPGRLGRAALLLALASWPASPLHSQDPPEAEGSQEVEDPYPIEELERQAEGLRGGPPGALGSALQELAYAYVYHSRPEDAAEVGREASLLLEMAGDTAGVALTHNYLGLAHWNLVHYDSAVVHFSRARDLWLAVDDRGALGRVYNNLGAAHYQWGNYELALSSFLRALEYRRELGQEAGQALALANVGRTYHDWGQFVRAGEAYEEAIRISDRVDYTFGQAYARLNLGELHLDQGELDRAEELFLRSMDHYGAEGSPIPPGDALGGRVLNSLGLARIRVSGGDLEGGLALLRETLETARSAEHPRFEARALLELGRAHQAAGEYGEAVRHLEEGLALARDRDQRPIAVDLLATLAEVEELRGVPGRALAHLQAHVALRDSIFDQSAVQRIAAMETQAELDRQERENILLREDQGIQEAVIARQRTVTLLTGALLLSAVLLLGLLVHFNRRGRQRARVMAETNRSLEEANRSLKEAQSEVRALRGLIPICSHCKRMRDDEGYWRSLESYIGQRSEASFSHSICAECGPRLYGEDWKDPRRDRETEPTPADPSTDAGPGRP